MVLIVHLITQWCASIMQFAQRLSASITQCAHNTQNGAPSTNMGPYTQVVFCVQGGMVLHWNYLDVIFFEKAKIFTTLIMDQEHTTYILFYSSC